MNVKYLTNFKHYKYNTLITQGVKMFVRNRIFIYETQHFPYKKKKYLKLYFYIVVEHVVHAIFTLKYYIEIFKNIFFLILNVLVVFYKISLDGRLIS